MNLEIANRLQQLRKEKGYSQEELANELGISRQAVSKWERAESSPDTDNLICLARLYGVSLDELLSTDETTEEIIENKSEIIISEEEMIEKEQEEEKPIISSKSLRIITVIEGIIPIITVITYLLLGSLLHLWHPGWIVFVLMPAILSIFECIKFKKVSAFVYPCFAAAVFLFLGTVFDWWHPGWVIFLTIPLFYIIAGKIDE